jgi:hypothetical protein
MRSSKPDDAGRTWQTVGTHHKFPTLFYEFGSPVLFATDQTGWIEQQNPSSTNTLWRAFDGGGKRQQVRIPGT